MTFTGANGTATTATRKYAGAWVPVVIFNGKRIALSHCSTSYGAADLAAKKAKRLVND